MNEQKLKLQYTLVVTLEVPATQPGEAQQIIDQVQHLVGNDVEIEVKKVRTVKR